MRRIWLILSGVPIGGLLTFLVVSAFATRYSVVGCETRVVLDLPPVDTTPLGDPRLERLRARLDSARRAQWDLTPGERYDLATKMAAGTATARDFPPLPPTRREHWCTVLDRWTGTITERRST